MEETKKNAILMTADLMAAAALTAPKASGYDTIRTAIITGEEKDQLRDRMLGLAEEWDHPSFGRDAGNVDRSECVVFIGCTGNLFGIDHCGLCGHGDCRGCKEAGGRCVLTLSDLGIAVGSAVSVAADHRIDNRVMYTAGRAAIMLGLLPEDCEVCYGIPLSISSKSIFFDRGPGAVINCSTKEAE